MKSQIAILFAAFAIASSLSRAEDYTLTLDLSFDTKYVFRGQQLADNALHPSVEFSKDNAYVGFWAAQPLENRGWPEKWNDELDFYAGFEWALAERASIDVGGIYYYYPTLDGEGTFEPYIGISQEIQGASTSLYVYRDFDLESTTLEGAASYSFPLGPVTSADFGIHLGTVDLENASSYLYYGADLVFPVELNDRAILSLGVHYSENDIGDLVPDNHLHGSTSISIGF